MPRKMSSKKSIRKKAKTVARPKPRKKLGRPPLGKKAMTAAERKRRSRSHGKVIAETINAAIVEEFKSAFCAYCNDRSREKTVWDIYQALLKKFPSEDDQRRITYYLMPMVRPDDDFYPPNWMVRVI